MLVDHPYSITKTLQTPSPLESYERFCTSRFELDDQFVIETVESLAELTGYLPAWQRLSNSSLVANPFYEPYYLLPAIQNLHPKDQIKFCFVFRKSLSNQRDEQLTGFFPLHKRSNSLLSMPRWRLFNDDLILRSVPLLENSHPEQTLTAFLQWAARTDIRLLEFDRVPGEGPFQHALIHALRETRTIPCYADQTSNAVLDKSMREPEGKSRAMREIGRKRRRLEDLGRLDFRILEDRESLPQWQQDFLRLEASGWKGREGTALALTDRERELFLTITRQASDRGKLLMAGLFLNDQPIAMKCNLVSGQEGLAWKIAYDEEYSRFSPGLVLEVDHKDYFLNHQPHLTRIDFCACSAHPLCRRIEHSQFCMQRLLIPCHSLIAGLYCDLLPLLRRLKRHVLHN